MGRFRKYFLTGVAVTVPTLVTIWVVYKLLKLTNETFSPLVIRFVGRDIPGLSVAFLVVIILIIALIGMLASHWVGKKFVDLTESIFARIPIVRVVYLTLKQIADVLTIDKKGALLRAVLVEYPRRGIYTIGFVTSECAVNVAGRDEGMATVFIPTTPNPTSGMLMLLPVRDLIPLNISVEDSLKLVVSGGVLAPQIWGKYKDNE